MEIDPNILNIVLGLITNGLTSLLASSGRKTGTLLIGKEFLEKWEIEKTSLAPLLHSAICQVAETVEWKGYILEEIVSLFLLSPEVEDVVRQVYSTEIDGNQTQGSLLSIRRIFLSLFTQFVASYPSVIVLKEEDMAYSVNALFEALIKGCNLVLSDAIDRGILAAHTAQSAFRHNIIASEIDAIQKKLDFLLVREEVKLQDILDFEKKYRQQVGHRYSSITLPNFDATQKVPITDIYVDPHVQRSQEISTVENNYFGYQNDTLNTEEFLAYTFRAVLLGDPGGGKSTFTFKLCYDLATTRYSERWFAGRTQLTPVRVSLRDYGTNKKSHRWSILEFIEIEAKATYQIQSPPPGAMEYLLLNGRLMVIFDGLDELLDTHARQEISNDVESFCHLYPSVPVLVTSRKIGYEQAPLDKNLFEVFYLSAFSKEQVQDYTEKWFGVANKEIDSIQQQDKVQSFLQESEIVPDLRSNPLMLALLCNIYRGENYIPRNRPEIYRKCSIMLFERWDQSRGIRVALPFEARLRPALMYLAYWIYEDEVLQQGVVERKLIAKTVDYLYLRRFKDKDEAEQAAREFLEFCKGRAWVFSDVGTLKDGERLYQFTHQTFLEYFAAEYLVRTHPTPDRLLRVLHPKIMKREWDVVAQLAFQIQDTNVENAGEELLRGLIEELDKREGIEQWSLFSFAVRCLSFIIPSPDIIKSITETCIHNFFVIGREEIEEIRVPNSLSGLLDLEEREDFFCSLLCTAIENRAEMANVLESFLIERILHGEENIALLSIEVALGLTVPLPGDLSDTIDFWDAVSDRIFTGCSFQVELLSQKYFLFCYYGVMKGNVEVADLVRWHGVESIFYGYPFNIFVGISNMSIAWTLIERTIDVSVEGEHFQENQKFFLLLKEVGEILLRYRPPWVKSRLGPWNVFENLESVETYKDTLNLDSSALFGAFALCATHLESSLSDETIQLITKSQHPLLMYIRQLLLARFVQGQEAEVRSEIEKLGFLPEQRALIQQWVHKEVDFVQLKSDE